MARKLTEEERETVEALRVTLNDALPPNQRGIASGIASALVRIPADTVTEEDLGRILGKYEEADEACAQVVRDTLLDAVEGQEGVYTLRVPEMVADGDAEGGVDAFLDADRVDVAGDGPADGDMTAGGDVSHEDADGHAAAHGDSPADKSAEDAAGSRRGASGEHGDKDDEVVQGAVASAPDGGHGEEASGSEPGKAQGEDGSSEHGSAEPAPAEDAPTAKPKRSRRRARRTHKTAESAQDAPAGDAADDEAQEGQPDAGDSGARDGDPEAQSGSSDQGEDKPQDVKPGRGSRSRGVRSEKGPKAQVAKAQGGQAQDGKGSTESKSDAGKGSQKTGGKSAADSGVQPSSAKPDRGHHKDSSRDLKKVPYVRRGGETEAEVRQKILNLDQRFWLNGWLLSHPAAYTLYERELLAINDALKDGMLPGDITRRQLAYQMGGDEKFFEYGSDGFRLLRAMGMEDVIRHRPMPKPDLVYYAPRRRKHMRVLVTENLDPYLDVHDLMYEDGRTSILGQRIHAVVLGGGTPILERNRLALLLDTLGADTVTVLYWGDIDRAGLEIMVKLKEVLGDGYKFRAFTPAYQLMVDKASERFPDPADNESTGQVNIEPMDASLLVDGLTDEAADYAKAVIDDCGLIPQEILTRRDL